MHVHVHVPDWKLLTLLRPPCSFFFLFGLGVFKESFLIGENFCHHGASLDTQQHAARY